MSTDPASSSPPDSATLHYQDTPVPGGPPEGPIIARAGGYYRKARYFMVLLMVGFAVAFLYDGFIGYPKANKAFLDKPENKDPVTGKIINRAPHTDTDITLQKILGFILLPGGIVYLFYFLHQSRDAYRLDGDLVTIPGHPPFRLSDVTAIDRKLWDRKGIAFIEYQTADGAKGRAKLDDFIYDRKPTDLIYDAILADLNARAQASETHASETQASETPPS